MTSPRRAIILSTAELLALIRSEIDRALSERERPSWLPVQGAAEALGCSPRTVRRLVSEGTLMSSGGGRGSRRLLVSRESIEAWLLLSRR